MVIKLNTSYVYEPGDEVYSLQHSRSGVVTDIISLNLAAQSQKVMVRLRGSGKFVEVDASMLELKYRTGDSIFADLKKPVGKTKTV